MDLLVVGGSGFVGAHLVSRAVVSGHRVGLTYAASRVDLPPARAYRVTMEETGALEACLEDSQPDAIVYCAVPPPRSTEALHRLVSVEGIQRVVTWLRASSRRVLLVYVSTCAPHFVAVLVALRQQACF